MKKIFFRLFPPEISIFKFFLNFNFFDKILYAVSESFWSLAEFKKKTVISKFNITYKIMLVIKFFLT